MSILDQYPKNYRNMTERLRVLLARGPGVEPREHEDLARAINGMADKACDLNEIFQRQAATLITLSHTHHQF